jgi:hypothetical protein
VLHRGLLDNIDIILAEILRSRTTLRNETEVRDGPGHQGGQDPMMQCPESRALAKILRLANFT